MLVKTKKIAVTITIDPGFSGGNYNELIDVSYYSDDTPFTEAENLKEAASREIQNIILENIVGSYMVIDDDDVAERLQGTYWGEHENLEDVIEDIKQDIEDEEDADDPI